MFLQRVFLRNFRGFYGDQSIDFAPLGESSVTVIHGENGAGKTNLLNAIFWCLTGEFTPRLSNSEMLHNKTARDEDKEAECFVEVTFRHEDRQYLARRTVTGRNLASLEVLPLADGGIGKPFTNPQQFLEKIIPKGLSRWFFFDAEAIGELELSGSTQFRQELRKVLGFELVDRLLEDLDRCLSTKQSSLAKAVNSKELDAIQDQRVKIEHVLPAQREKAKTLELQLSAADARVSKLEGALRSLPRSKPLQDSRNRLEARRKNCVANKKELLDRIARCVGDSAPALLIASMAVPFQDQLHLKENSGRLPAPFSEQLVEDILRDAICVCGRSVDHGSCEEVKIKSLMRSASTTAFNQRVRSIQYLLKDIEATRETYGQCH